MRTAKLFCSNFTAKINAVVILHLHNSHQTLYNLNFTIIYFNSHKLIIIEIESDFL
jgi:hypothetical protein